MPTTEAAVPSWYETVTGPDLAQGDLLQEVLLPFISSSDPNRPEISLERTSAIVLTQTCDLENRKVTQVLLGAISPYARYAEAERSRGKVFVASRRFRKAVLEGALPPLAVLRPSDAAGPPLEWSLIDFRRLYTLPLDDIQRLANSLGTRLRLKSPYREHVAQSFARFHMRVGLPTDAADFESLANA
jgi:hypothetical protein